MVPSRKNALWPVALICCVALIPSRSSAQWWTAAPADFEDCAERADSASGSKDARTSLIAACESKFAGRRKPGGGYTYYDFMQNRSFDIAGPNPTADEQRKIDEHYTVYLEQHRHSIIRAAFAEKQRQQQQAMLEIDQQRSATAPQPSRRAQTTAKPRPPRKKRDCTTAPLACGWSRLSAAIKDVKKSLFGASRFGASTFGGSIPRTKRT